VGKMEEAEWWWRVSERARVCAVGVTVQGAGVWWWVCGGGEWRGCDQGVVVHQRVPYNGVRTGAPGLHSGLRFRSIILHIPPKLRTKKTGKEQ